MLVVALTFFSGCDSRFINKEIKPFFDKKPDVITLTGKQRGMMDELRENREKIQILEKEQAALLDANRKLFNQLEFVGERTIKRHTKPPAAPQSAQPPTVIPLNEKKYSEFDLNEMGVEAFSKGNYDLALSHFNTATAINPEFYEVFTNKGVVYMALGQYPQAIAHFKKALKINPDFKVADNYLRQAEASLKSGTAR